MQRKKYEIEMEVSGPFAMFAQPDSGSERISYPVPPFSAAKGMMESVLFDPRVEVRPTRVEICQPTRFADAGFNAAFSPERKAKLIKDGNTMQVRQVVLTDVIFKIYAHVVNKTKERINHAHSYQDRFNRKIKRGQCFRHVTLGVTDFPAEYFGPLREETSPCEEVNTALPVILFHPHNDDGGRLAESKPSYCRNVQIEQGVMEYVDPTE